MEKMSDVLLLWKLLNIEKLRNKSKTTVFRRIDFADDEWRVAERYQRELPVMGKTLKKKIIKRLYDKIRANIYKTQAHISEWRRNSVSPR
jgi:hypothetical protein